jgi:predicted nucleic acid-binding protein
VARPGTRHFGLFLDLIRHCNAKGNLITDAYLAALAIENGCRFLTFDRDFARFPGFDWATPDLS